MAFSPLVLLVCVFWLSSGFLLEASLPRFSFTCEFLSREQWFECSAYPVERSCLSLGEEWKGQLPYCLTIWFCTWRHYLKRATSLFSPTPLPLWPSSFSPVSFSLHIRFIHINCLSFSTDDLYLATSSSTETVHIFKLTEPTQERCVWCHSIQINILDLSMALCTVFFFVSWTITPHTVKNQGAL